MSPPPRRSVPITGEPTASGGQVGRWFEVPHRALRADFRNVSQELTDLVRLATAASRLSVGHLVWASWVQGGKNKPGHGSTLLLLDGEGACDLLARLPTAEPESARELQKVVRELKPVSEAQKMVLDHFDLELLRVLRNDSGPKMEACYLHPPMGGYAVHPSGCDPTFDNAAGRPAQWDQAWSCPGTRRAEDPQNREKWLCGFRPGKPVKWIAQIHLDTEDRELHWRSYWAGAGPRPRQMDPVEPPATGSWGDYRGGGKGRGAAGAPGGAASSSGASGSGSAAGEPTAPAARGATAGGEPTAPPAEEAEDTGHRTKRAKRELRSQRLYSGFRNFVNEREQASRLCRPPHTPLPACTRQASRIGLRIRTLSRTCRLRFPQPAHASHRSPPAPLWFPAVSVRTARLRDRSRGRERRHWRVSPPPPQRMRRAACRAVCARRRTPSWAWTMRSSPWSTSRTGGTR